MDKKELFEKSRRENERADEYEKDIMLKGFKFSFAVTAVFVVFFSFYKSYDKSYIIILTAMGLSYNLYNAIKMKSKSYIIATVIWSIAFVIYIILYVVSELERYGQ